MSAEIDEEQAWNAEKRQFVADSRDESADGRHLVAEAREQAADAREAELEAWERRLKAWERRLKARAAELGLKAEPRAAVGQRGTRTERRLARTARTADGHERQKATLDRDDATKRRLADSGSTPLALAFAALAEELYDSETFDDVLQRIAQAAVSTVAGCDVASITIVEEGQYRTAAATDATATAVDKAQYQAEEGPGLDALKVSLVYAQAFPDERWPVLASQPTESGVQSAVSYRLGTLSHDDLAGAGSLNTYATTPDSFDAAAQEIGVILAAHAAVAARAVGERTTLEGFGRHLQQALLSRDVIGQAKGILMERLRITPEDAFDVLRRSSQQLNLKLREVATMLAETGEVQAPPGEPKT